MSWLLPNTKPLETQSSRNRAWIEWAKGYVSGVSTVIGLVIAALEIWSRLQ